jgi:ankyrin repeat protein
MAPPFAVNRGSDESHRGTGQSSGGSRRKLPSCFKCGKKGHLSRDCKSSEEEKAEFKRRQKAKKNDAGADQSRGSGAKGADTSKTKVSCTSNNPSSSKSKKSSNKKAPVKKTKAKPGGAPSLAREVLGVPLIRSTILGFLNPMDRGDFKAIMSFHYLGFISTNDLKHYFETKWPALKVPIGSKELEEFLERGFDKFKQLAIRDNKENGTPRSLDKYYINEKMEAYQMRDVLKNDYYISKRWLKGKSKKQIWSRYKYLSYIPIQVYDHIRRVQYYSSDEDWDSFPMALLALATVVSGGVDGKVIGSWIERLKREYGEFGFDPEDMPNQLIFNMSLGHIAAAHGHVATLKYLVENSFTSTTDLSLYDRNLVHWAAYSRRLPMLRFVCESYPEVDPKAVDSMGLTALHFAAWTGSAESCDYLIRKMSLDPHATDVQGHSVLFEAVRHGHIDVVRLLVETHKVDPHQTSHKGLSLVHVMEDQVDMINLLVGKYKLDVNALGPENRTAVHAAVSPGRSVEALQLLVDKYGADITAETDKGENAFHFAAGEGSVELARLLVETYDFDPRAKTKTGLDAIEIAHEYFSI